MIRTLTISLAAVAMIGVCCGQDSPSQLNLIVDEYDGVFEGDFDNRPDQSRVISAEGQVIRAVPMEGLVTPIQPIFDPPTAVPEKVESTGPRRSVKSRLVPALPKEYEARDKNGDGQIGMYEWDRTKYAEFMKLDKNGDGFLTPQELSGKGQAFGAKPRRDQEAIPNPGNLLSYNDKFDQSYVVSVTGRTTGSVWGTGTYTTDSDLATAAVHAGILKDGESGSIQVTIVKSPPQFAGSSANGVTSNGWQSFPAAFTIR